MTISPPEREQKKEPVLDKPIETDAIPVDFTKLDKPGFWSKTLAKGPKTTTWIWNLHADAHDFDTMLEIYKKPVEKYFLLILAT